ncbi:histidine phosphatase family protein [Croceicoccus naphthovorans]|nr:histidine phosphatase family protein [Croceicoccus naphthovorans]
MRHGPPLRPGLLLGHGDEPAVPGSQAFLVSRSKALHFDAVATSDLERAKAGAAAIARARGIAFALDPRWRELHFGAWDGLDPAAIEQGQLQSFWSDPDANPPPSGERWGELKERVSSAISAIGGSTLVVTHGGAMRAAISVLTGLDHRGVWAFDLPYGAVVSLRIWRESGAKMTRARRCRDR